MFTKEQYKQFCWASGNLDYKLWNYPQNVIEAKYKEVRDRGGRFLFINCARRSGKTHWNVKKAIETCIKPIKFGGNPKPRIKIGAAFYEDLQEFVIPAFDSMTSDKPQGVPLYQRSSKRKYICPATGGEIKLVGLDLKPNGLRGTYADLVILEEAGFMKRLWYQYSDICIPMTANRPGAMIIMNGTPPETPDHEWVEFKEKAIAENAYIEIDVEKNDKISSIERAKLLAECRDESTRQREWYCKVVINASKAIIPEWNEQYCVETYRDEWFNFYDVYEGMDLGIVDQTVALFSYYDFKQAKLIIEQELVMNGPEMTTNKLGKAILNQEALLYGPKRPYLRISDNDNLLLLQDLAAEHKLSIAEVKKTTLESMVNDVRIWVQAGRILVNPRCKMLLGCLRTGIWNEKRDAFERSKIFGHYDALAALIYLIRGVNPNRNPFPQHYGMNPDTHIIKEKEQLEPSLQALKRAFNIPR